MIATHDELMTVKEVARLMSVPETTILLFAGSAKIGSPPLASSGAPLAGPGRKFKS